jgi:hypothetical protein
MQKFLCFLAENGERDGRFRYCHLLTKKEIMKIQFGKTTKRLVQLKSWGCNKLCFAISSMWYLPNQQFVTTSFQTQNKDERKSRSIIGVPLNHFCYHFTYNYSKLSQLC